MPTLSEEQVKVTVHIETDDTKKYKAAKEYNVQGTGDDSDHAVCYIEAQLGKRFVVKLSNSDWNVHAILWIDGQRQVRYP